MLLRQTSLLLTALALSAGPVGAQTPRCADYVPQPRPQNVGKSVIGQDLDTIVRRGHISIAVYEDFPPFSWNSDTGPQGIDIEIGRLIARALDVKARFNIVAASDNIEADLRYHIWQGPIVSGSVSNVMMRIPYDPAFSCRVEQIAFTGQYSREGIAIAYRKASYPDAPPLPGHFRRKTVAVENGSIADFYLSSLISGQIIPNMHRYRTTALAMQALAEGEVSAAMGSLSQLQYSLGKGKGIDIHQPTLPGFSISEWDIGVGVHSSYRPLAYAIDDAIAAGLKNGRIKAIYAKYGIGFAAPER